MTRNGCCDSVVAFNSSVWSDVTPRATKVALASEASGSGARWPAIFTMTASGAVAAVPPAIDAITLSIVWPLANFRSLAVASTRNCGAESSPLAVPRAVTLPEVCGTISASYAVENWGARGLIAATPDSVAKRRARWAEVRDEA